MRIEHLAIDGSVIVIEADADLTTEATATGWAIVPSLMRTYPFSIHPAGHSKIVEETVRATFRNIEISAVEDYSLKGGTLRVSQVRLPTATKGTRSLTVGAWEGQTGCLSTSVVDEMPERLVEIFDTLQFSEHRRGLAIDSPITMRPRVPEVIKEIPGMGILNIRPGIANELEQIPKSRGYVTEYGEIFRTRAQSDSVMFVSRSTVVRIAPLTREDTREMLSIARNLQVEWVPRGMH